MPLIQWIMQDLQPQPSPPVPPKPRRAIVFPPPRPVFGGGGSGGASRVWEKYCKDLVERGIDPVDFFKQQPGTFDHVAPDGVFPPAQPNEDEGDTPPSSGEDGSFHFTFNQQNIQNNFYFGAPLPADFFKKHYETFNPSQHTDEEDEHKTLPPGEGEDGSSRLNFNQQNTQNNFYFMKPPPVKEAPSALLETSSTATAPETATQTAPEVSALQPAPQPVFLAGPAGVDGITIGMGMFLLVGGLILGGVVGYLVYLQIQGKHREDERDDEDYYGEIDEDLQ